MVLRHNEIYTTSSFEEYLKGVVPYEMPHSFTDPLEVLKAQAIAARCYAATVAKGKHSEADVCARTCCQRWEPGDEPGKTIDNKWDRYIPYPSRTTEAVTETGEIGLVDYGKLL